jgi:hypothetical protein
MIEDENKNEERDLMYHLAGWILFILCALFFIVSSIKNWDALTFIGSIFFLIANIVFLIPLVRTIKRGKSKRGAYKKNKSTTTSRKSTNSK